MQETETIKENRELNGAQKSTLTKGNITQETQPVMQRSKTPVAVPVTPVLVSERQFETVRQEHLTSMDLLNKSGTVLLEAMQSMVPPQGSGRVVGEYSAQGIRQIAKSICDVVMTKTSVVRAIYSIARDEH